MSGTGVATACRGASRVVVMSVVAALMASAPTASVTAETLFEALAAAYATNPTLNAKRSELRAIDEEVARAKSGFRPTVTHSADTGVEHSNTGVRVPRSAAASIFSDGKTRPTGYSFMLEQSLFRGMRSVNAVKEAKASVRAGREDLRATEQATLLAATTAYVDVVRDRAIVELNENNVNVLAEQLKATQDRFEVGEVTKTDVAQAEARLAGARSALSLAQANLKTSRAAYERVIGHPPNALSEVQPIDRLLPTSLQDAMQVGESENPTILQRVFLEEAQRYTVKQVEGELLPTITFEARYQQRYETSRSVEDQETATFTGRITVPLYQAGEVSARVRQSKETKRQRQRQISEARAQIQADIVSAWGQLDSARAQIVSDQAQVRANEIALNGVREEEKVGQRTVLDVLDAEQELLDSKVQLVGSKRDAVVASYTLLAAVGRLDVTNLSLPVAEYDPDEHYRRTKNKILGLNPDRASVLYYLENRLRGDSER